MSKIRTDFVTNSSSSSYIIAFKDLSILKKKYKDVPFMDCIETLIETLLEGNKNDYEDSGEIIDSSENFEKYFCNKQFSTDTLKQAMDRCQSDWELESFNNQMKIYNKCKKALNGGYKILFREVSYNNDSSKELISSIIKQKDFAILISGEN